MRWLDYRQKLNIGFNDKEIASYIAAVALNKLEVYFDKFSNLPWESIHHFCNMIGVRVPPTGREQQFLLSILHTHSLDVWDFIAYYIALVNSVQLKHKSFLSRILINVCKNASLPIELIEDDDGLFVFPKGAPELDDNLVSQPLEWLSSYPKSQSVFIKALQKYSKPDIHDARTIADEFRKALEGFFQEFFSSGKSLENLKSEYGIYLKGHGIPKEIASNLENLLQLYTGYMNNYVKHKDNASDELLEYIMYQTGNIIRLLITLKKSESTT